MYTKHAAICVFLIACAGDDGSTSGPFCGDGTCNGGETTTTCATDCGAPCSASNDNCAGEAICVANACVAAFPRVYSITNVSVSVPTTNPNTGSAWDVGGGAPDLYLGDVNGVAFSPTVQDQFSAAFAGPFDVQLVAGQTLAVAVWDADLTTNDFAFGCQTNPVTAANLRGRSFGCTTQGMSMTARIDPK
jgi:hypothetical protein